MKTLFFRCKKLIPYITIIIFLCIVFVILLNNKGVRVGDGSEYYGMFFAWSDSHRPWMSPSSFDAYEHFWKINEIYGLITVEQLKNAFPLLRLGDTADFNHFWFYSFLAYLASLIANFFNLNTGSHQAFMFLHFILALSVFIYAYYAYKWRGLLIVALLTFSSPMIWYLDKVHTEFFTYCFSLLSVMLTYRKKYLASSFFLALASTQNPSFALVAFIPFIYRFVFLRQIKFTFVEACLGILISVLVCAHPIYYFLRYGVTTPQLLAGGADVGTNLAYFYIWIIDPDIGLLTNWPYGAIVILLLTLFHRNINKSKDFYLITFVLSFVIISLYAQSSTTNVNSGASLGPARYALWYIPLFFIPSHCVLLYLKKYKKIYTFFIFFFIALCIVNVSIYNPKKHESYDAPSFLSNLIQTKISYLYDPHPEIFAERFSGKGEGINQCDPSLIIGPDYKKILVLSNSKINKNIISRVTQNIDPDVLGSIIYDTVPRINQEIPYYYMLDEQSAKKLIDLSSKANQINPGKWLKHDSRMLVFRGWSVTEPHHRWSLGKSSEIDFTVCSPLNFKGDLLLDGSAAGRQHVDILLNGRLIYSGIIDGESKINAMQFKPDSLNKGINTLKFVTPDCCLASPTDPRIIGICLRNIMVK